MWIKAKEVGGTVKAFKKGSFLGLQWKPTTPQWLQTGYISSNYKRQLADKSCIDVHIGRVSGSNYLNPARVTFPDIDNIFTQPNTLQTEHWATVNGVSFGFGKGVIPLLKID